MTRAEKNIRTSVVAWLFVDFKPDAKLSPFALLNGYLYDGSMVFISRSHPKE